MKNGIRVRQSGVETTVRIGLVGLCLLLSLMESLFAQQHGGHHPAKGHDMSAHHSHHHHVELEAKPLSDHSVYQLNRTWQSHRGESLQLKDFMGRPLIVVMFYGSCMDVCPILIQDSWRLYRGVDESKREDIRVIAVTFDGERDTVESLMNYAQRERLDLPNWHFLSGSEQAVRELAMVLGVEYRKRSDGMFDHTNLVAVLDRQGEIAKRVVGLGREMEPASELLEKLLREEEK